MEIFVLADILMKMNSGFPEEKVPNMEVNTAVKEKDIKSEFDEKGFVECKCKELEERCRKAEVRCLELESEVGKTKTEKEALEAIVRALEMEKIGLEDELRNLKWENGRKGVVDLSEEEIRILKLMINDNVLDSYQQMDEKEAEEKKQMKESLVLRDDEINVEGSLQDAGIRYNDTRTPDKPCPSTKNQESDVGGAGAPSTSTSSVPASVSIIGSHDGDDGNLANIKSPCTLDRTLVRERELLCNRERSFGETMDKCKEADEKKQMKEGLVLRDEGLKVENSEVEEGTRYNDTRHTPDNPSPSTKNQKSDVGRAGAPPSTSTSAVPASVSIIGSHDGDDGDLANIKTPCVLDRILVGERNLLGNGEQRCGETMDRCKENVPVVSGSERKRPANVVSSGGIDDNIPISRPTRIRRLELEMNHGRENSELKDHPLIVTPTGIDNAGNRYENQKRRDWRTFSQYFQIQYHPPLSLSTCSGTHVIEFLRYLDQFGKTKVHNKTCPHFGLPNPPAQCSCPLRQAWGSLDALVGRLRAAYEEHIGISEGNPFGAVSVRKYLMEVRNLQAYARGVSYAKKSKRPRQNVYTTRAATK